MNLSALKSFAPEVRRQLIEAVGRKLDFVLTGDTADLRAAAEQVAHLRIQADADRSGLIERVAYTWFNRLAALRFIDAHPGWHPFRARVVTPANTDETQPELLKLTRSGSIPAELARFTDSKRLNDLLDGHLPSPDPQGEVYRHLILATCRFYHDLMPFLFEALDDETELLLPDDLLTEHSIAHGFRTGISEEDCSEVELVGWLYQFYISEKKDQVMARKSAVPSEDIPAVTQLFTPHWIVRYLVENSLGRLWLNSRPASRLREHMPYYVEDPDGQSTTDCLTVARPEEIKLLDPASGSGHMLTYSFDLLYRIYEEEGHAPSEIPALILQNNLYGLDICPRAEQLAQFALICKAREKSRTAFRNPIQPQVMCLVDVVITPEEMQSYLELPGMRELFTENVLRQIHQFRENTSSFGSLIQPVLTAGDITKLKARLAVVVCGDSPLQQLAHQKILRVLEQAEMLSQRYHVVVANPPYMGAAAMNSKLKDFVETKFEIGRGDSYAAFLLRNITLALSDGCIGMITIPNWMFISSFMELRSKLLATTSIKSLIHCGRGVWGSDFGSCAFVLGLSATGSRGYFKRLFRVQGEVQSNQEIEQNFFEIIEFPLHAITASELLKIPGYPIAYWLCSRAIDNFAIGQPLSAIAEGRSGMSSCNSELFLRLWHEVSTKQIGFLTVSHDEAAYSGKKWFHYNKGGGGRKWSGYNNVLINWANDGGDIKRFVVSNPRDPNTNHWSRRLFNLEYFFRPGITWSAVTSARFAARLIPDCGVIPGTGSKTLYEVVDEQQRLEVLAFLNSVVATYYLKALSPTLNFEAGDVGKLPVLPLDVSSKNNVVIATKKIWELSRADWDNFETSWDFSGLPLLRLGQKGATLDVSWRNWETQCTAAVSRMQELETENNQLFIAAYGLEGELQPEVPEPQITLARPDRRKDMAAFLSYAVGCMMGRYSLDAPGLILANAGDTLEQYLTKVGKPLDQLTFAPDEDGIIPVLDGEWFEDDIVARTRDFLRATFGDAMLETNLHFIEESLGKDLRKYFLTDFYRDHLQTYKKRPIYWMFQSPKKGFSALVYLHRYTKDTPNRLLSSYLRDFMHKLRGQLEHLDHLTTSESTSARDVTKARKEIEQFKKTLRECEDWEREVLLPLAQKRIELDLDDGVKVNYLKLGAALATIPGLAAKEDE